MSYVCACRMCSVPYSMLPYCLFYIGSHVVSWSIIINTIHVECFVHSVGPDRGAIVNYVHAE